MLVRAALELLLVAVWHNYLLIYDAIVFFFFFFFCCSRLLFRFPSQLRLRFELQKTKNPFETKSIQRFVAVIVSVDSFFFLLFESEYESICICKITTQRNCGEKKKKKNTQTVAVSCDLSIFHRIFFCRMTKFTNSRNVLMYVAYGLWSHYTVHTKQSSYHHIAHLAFGRGQATADHNFQ